MPLHPGCLYVSDSNRVYREEGAEDGDRKREGSGSAGRARGNDAGPRRHGQDRSPGRGEEEAQRAEVALREVSDETGVEWTIVRCAWFMQNFDESFWLEPILSGEVALPSGDV